MLGKPHFWQQMTVEHLFFITVIDNLRRYPLIRRLGQWILPNLTVSIRDKHSGYSRQQIAKLVALCSLQGETADIFRRLANKSARKDILTNVVGKVETGEIPQEELTAHASTLMYVESGVKAKLLTSFSVWQAEKRSGLSCRQ